MTKSTRQARLRTPTFRFSPTAWAKLLFLRDAGDTEIGGFGVSRPDDLLCVDDVVLVRQETTPVRVAFDDVAVADFFEDQVDRGRRPEMFARIWIHTHPGGCPLPSPTDEATFRRVFGGCDWAVMAILARNGATYARLQWHVGPGGAVELPTTVDYRFPFGAADPAAWQAEYDRCVHPRVLFPAAAEGGDDVHRGRLSHRLLTEPFSSLFEPEF